MVWWFFDISAFCDVFSYSNFVHAVSGGVGSALALTVFFPLETARTRLQVDQSSQNSKYSFGVVRQIVTQEGVRGLYRGCCSLLLSLSVTNFIYFYAFHALKAALCHAGLARHVYTDLLFGVCAGCVSVLITNPLWVVSTRLKLQDAKFQGNDHKNLKRPRYFGTFDCLSKIIRYEGALHLWSGTGSSLLLVSNPAVQFMVYETLKRQLQLFFEDEYLGGSCYFVCGAAAKIAATLITYPLQVVQTRLRAGYGRLAKPENISVLSILKRHGVLGLYKGLEAKLTQTVLTSALMFMAYETISSYIFSIFGLEPS